MSDDLETLLRDAGRAPTIDLDVAAVHAAGRRRATTRNVAVGAGALALFGVLGVGVQALLPDVGPPEIIDDPDDAAPSGDAALAAELGVGTARVVVEDGRVTLVRARPDGTVVAVGDESGALAEASQLELAADGAVWGSAGSGQLLVHEGSDSVAATPVDAPGGAPVGQVLGTGPGGAVLVGTDTTDAATFQLYTSVGAELDGPVPGLDPYRGSAAGTFQLVRAAGDPASPEEFVLLDAVAETYLADLVLLGEGGQTLLSLGGSHALVDLAAADRAVWGLELDTADRSVDLLYRPYRSDVLTRVPTPLGRDVEGDVVAFDVVTGPSGPVVALSVAPFDAPGTVVSFVADGRELLAAGVPSREMADDTPDDVPAAWTRTELPGVLLLAPLGDGEPTDGTDDGSQQAACAGGDVAFNEAPDGTGGQVWWLCWDAVASLPDGVAHPFVARDAGVGGRGATTTEVELLALLRRWAEGPSPEDVAAGLSGGLDPEVATIAGVTDDGGNLIVDLAPGPQVGVLGTTTGRATFVQSIAAIVFQYDQFVALNVTVDGDCSRWGDIAETEGCLGYDRSAAAWAQTPSVERCSSTDEAFNGPPATDGQVSMWFSCFEEPVTLEPYPFYRVDVARPEGAGVEPMSELVGTWLEMLTSEQRSAGLSGWHRAGDVTLVGVELDGSRAAVTIEDTAVEREGGRSIPTGSGDGGSYRQALAGLLLQFDGIDEVVIVTNGNCGDWEGVEGPAPTDCIVWTLQDAPWVQYGQVAG